MHKVNSYKELFYYASPAFALALLGLPLYVYMPTFYAKDLHLGMFEVGLTLFIARFLDVLFDPFIGYVSDRYALRKSLVFFGSIILLGGFYFLTHPASNISYVWLFSFSIIVYFGWSMVSVAFFAIGSDISENYHQNTHYSSSRELFNIAGVVTAIIVPYSLNVAEDAGSSLMLLFQTIAVALPLTVGVFLLKVKAEVIQNSIHNMKQTFLQMKQYIKAAKYLFLSFFLNNFANVIPATLFLLYIEYVIGESSYTGILLLLYFLSGIIALPFWIYISKKYNKKRAWTLSMISASLFFVFVPFLSHGDLVLFTIITLFSGLSLGADMALPASMQADLAQEKSQENQYSGAMFGVFAMLTKLSLAFGVGFSFGILDLFDFDAQAPHKDSLMVLSLLYGLLPVALKLASVFVLQKYDENTK